MTISMEQLRVIKSCLKVAVVVTVSELDKNGSPKFYHREPAKGFKVRKSGSWRYRFYGKNNRYLGQIQVR